MDGSRIDDCGRNEEPPTETGLHKTERGSFFFLSVPVVYANMQRAMVHTMCTERAHHKIHVTREPRIHKGTQGSTDILTRWILNWSLTIPSEGLFELFLLYHHVKLAYHLFALCPTACIARETTFSLSNVLYPCSRSWVSWY